jgi:hypothetical protein
MTTAITQRFPSSVQPIAKGLLPERAAALPARPCRGRQQDVQLQPGSLWCRRSDAVSLHTPEVAGSSAAVPIITILGEDQARDFLGPLMARPQETANAAPALRRILDTCI